MLTFYDYYGNRVRLSFTKNAFSSEPKHVFVICRYRNGWLLTEHRERGLEFPGGKMEEGETPEEAAIREVREETGGIVRELMYLGQYEVMGKTETIIKNIYVAYVDELIQQPSYFETNGPVYIEQLPQNIRSDDRFSFIMKDDVLTYSLLEMKKRSFV
ncbi:8-oxo-dGTP diphosphatase [Thermolongibacillus altinsuensis]|jgi:8-oxo-dGTP diphosphatase|uniref:8-oxo-dGTP diphosphatase n=1 Tax=Thermolongibacillus altinsuensis TaxID=575256 RepID=A0A4R1QB07_9BACL|nr:nucleoside triphosphatase YtkD [Thermolongibacillus altinsuensis]TCL46543.1 8-oxo-dGTP diphosphatase [Thermolongibacillus altinsuensis]GMB09875.1 nucleoside triphosphatase YtkD [Thermolongibacillus altinsuensis]